jgi:hypothetical protein
MPATWTHQHQMRRVSPELAHKLGEITELLEELGR